MAVDFIAMDGPDGNVIMIPRAEWAAKVLPETLRSAWNDPNELHRCIVEALHDGFGAEVAPAARQLFAIDPDRERAATVQATVHLRRRDTLAAKAVLDEYIAQHGPTGPILTALARVWADCGNLAQAAAVQLESLKLDPNQEEGLQEWVSLHEEQEGETGIVRALQQIVMVPGSWRPQLWLAHLWLAGGKHAGAETLYRQIVKLRPVPDEALRQMSGELGTAGRLDLIFALVEPYYQPATGMMETGVNLLVACIETRQFQKGAALLQQLKARRRSDWQEVLNQFEQELAAPDDDRRPWWRFW